MKLKLKILIPIILAMLVLPWVGIGSAWAQSPIHAEIDRTSVSTGESLVLTVTVNGSSLLSAPQPLLPSLQGFSIVARSSSSQMSIVNGRISSMVVYTYRLQPYETGDLVIEPIGVTIGGQTYSTQPIVVHVTQGTGATGAPPAAAPAVPAQPAQPGTQVAAPAPDLTGQDFYVEALVDNPTPYVGQQVVYTFRFYQAANLWDQPQYQGPTFTGFWSEHQSDQVDYRIQAAGRVYQVTEISSILFPSVVGPLTIDPARLTIPGGFFNRGQNLQTHPVELDVQPLPPTAPPGFNGAVGQYIVTGSVDTAQGKVNEPLTWKVTISGRGNVTTAPDPIWTEMPGWRDFETQALVHSELVDGQVVGTRTYERLLVPTAQSEHAIPALEYVFFDPIAGLYQTIATEPIPVSIAPGAAEPPSTLPAGDVKETVAQVATDIRHLKAVPSELEQSNRPVTKSALYWLAWAFPVMGAAGYFVWQRRQRYWETNLGLARSSQARRKAKRALAQARKQERGVYSAAGQVLTVYLSDKLDIPVTGLTHQALADLLAERGIGSDLIERVEVLLVSSELGRFAPGADDPDHAASLLKEVGILVDTLEKVL